MKTLRDLDYAVKLVYDNGQKIYIYEHKDMEHNPTVTIDEKGVYTVSGNVTPVLHEGITGTLFKMGIYRTIGKHLKDHN